jgi:hypothetical protein
MIVSRRDASGPEEREKMRHWQLVVWVSQGVVARDELIAYFKAPDALIAAPAWPEEACRRQRNGRQRLPADRLFGLAATLCGDGTDGVGFVAEFLTVHRAARRYAGPLGRPPLPTSEG